MSRSPQASYSLLVVASRACQAKQPREPRVRKSCPHQRPSRDCLAEPVLRDEVLAMTTTESKGFLECPLLRRRRAQKQYSTCPYKANPLFRHLDL